MSPSSSKRFAYRELAPIGMEVRVIYKDMNDDHSYRVIPKSIPVPKGYQNAGYGDITGYETRRVRFSYPIVIEKAIECGWSEDLWVGKQPTA